MTFERANSVVFKHDISYKRNKDWEHWVLLSSDHHWDSKKCDRDLMDYHMKQAQDRNADVFILGDFFDCMGGKYDPRRSKGELRDELKVPNYFDALVEQAAEWLSPYAKQIRFISPGNHETAVLKNQEIDLTQRLSQLLNTLYDGETLVGKYAGYVVFKFKENGANKGRRYRVTMNYTHGYGGGGPVTKGTIQAQRRAVYTPDADIVVCGHIHESWVLEIMREKLSPNLYTPILSTQYAVQLPSYKEDFCVGEGWHRERGMPPKPTGAWWLRFFHSARDEKVKFEFIRAEV